MLHLPKTLVAPSAETKWKSVSLMLSVMVLRQSMERYDNLVLMGQDIAEYGGVFKITEGFVERFGKDTRPEYSNL